MPITGVAIADTILKFVVSYDSSEAGIWSLCVFDGKLYAGSDPGGIVYEGILWVWKRG